MSRWARTTFAWPTALTWPICWQFVYEFLELYLIARPCLRHLGRSTRIGKASLLRAWPLGLLARSRSWPAARLVLRPQGEAGPTTVQSARAEWAAERTHRWRPAAHLNGQTGPDLSLRLEVGRVRQLIGSDTLVAPFKAIQFRAPQSRPLGHASARGRLKQWQRQHTRIGSTYPKLAPAELIQPARLCRLQLLLCECQSARAKLCQNAHVSRNDEPDGAGCSVCAVLAVLVLVAVQVLVGVSV